KHVLPEAVGSCAPCCSCSPHPPAPTDIYTLSLHDALPIFPSNLERIVMKALAKNPRDRYQTSNDLRRALQSFLAESNQFVERSEDRKSTRLNSSHDQISYAVFCLKKKNSKYINASHLSSDY